MSDTILEELNQWMLAHHMRGYWMQEGGGSGPQRQAHLWKWADVYAGLLKAAELVSVGPSGLTEMRTIGLRNPERGVPRTASLGHQILMPGERTRAHRHLRNEAHFVVRAPRGATFVVEGEAFPMEAGDLVVSPAGTDHADHNGGAEPAIWLDALDVGLLNLLGTEVRERDPLPPHVANPASGEWLTGSVDSRRPFADKPTGHFSATLDQLKDPRASWAARRPPMRYPWAETFATLTALKDSSVGGDPYDGIHLRYTSPVDRGPTLPTFSCEIQLLTPGLETRAHRHNSTAIYHVVRGEGRTNVAGEQLEWTQGDIFCVPPWTWHHHENPAGEDAILYSIDDWPAMAKMGFHRVEGEADSAKR